MHRPLAETLGGGDWTVAALPTPSGSDTTIPASLSCAGVWQCVAVGSDEFGRPVAESRSGATWTAERLPSAPGVTSPPRIQAVACATSTACTASGNSNTARWGDPLPLETRTGGSWTAGTVAVPAAPLADLAGVSCWAPAGCVATGTYRNDPNSRHAFAETQSSTGWSGRPVLPTTAFYQDYGVACPSAGQCVTVGDAADGSSSILALTQSGSAWSATAVPIPDPMYSFHAASSPDCPDANFCALLLSYGSVAGAVTRTSGTWGFTPLPVPSGRSLTTTTLDCPRAGRCVGLENGDNGLYQATLAESGWTVTPVTTIRANWVTDASCVTATSCVVVGQAAKNLGPAVIDTLRNGQWRTKTLPLPSGSTAEALTGVSCWAPTSCIAVGSVTDAAGVQSPVVATLSGAIWTQQILADPADGVSSGLVDIDCPAAGSCTAVGTYRGRDGGDHPMAVSLP